jgi:hypothetical protein
MKKNYRSMSPPYLIKIKAVARSYAGRRGFPAPIVSVANSSRIGGKKGSAASDAGNVA